MIIKYEVDKFLKETHEIEILDTKNVFLQGTNPYDGMSTYFGIWANNKYLVIVTMISGRNISYDYSTSKSIYIESDIKKFLQHNNNVKVITKKEFKEQLDNFKSIIR